MVHCASRRQPCARRHGVLVSFLAKGHSRVSSSATLRLGAPREVCPQTFQLTCSRGLCLLIVTADFPLRTVQLIGKFCDFMHYVTTPYCVNLFNNVNVFFFSLSKYKLLKKYLDDCVCLRTCRELRQEKYLITPTHFYFAVKYNFILKGKCGLCNSSNILDVWIIHIENDKLCNFRPGKPTSGSIY